MLILGSRRRTLSFTLLTFLWIAGAIGRAEDSAFIKQLVQNRFELTVGNGGLSGAGSEVLKQALSRSKYILIGEDHGTAEIPQFVAAVCDVLAPQGLVAYGVEAGSLGTRIVAASLGRPDRLQQIADLQTRYPDSVAFFNLRGDNDAAQHCRAATNGKLDIWGLDQEFMGAAGLILDQILSTHPGAEGTSAVGKLREDERRAAAKALASGDPRQLMMMSESDSDLERAAEVIAKDGNAEAQKLMAALLESHQIYAKNLKGLPESNRQRALLLKTTLAAELSRMRTANQSGKVLFKFGDWHLYRGFNPLRQLDLGNFITELADGEGSSSLHVIVLGAKGAHLGYARYAKPYQPQPFDLVKDQSYGFMKPFVDNQAAKGWTLYDLRRLRFANFGAMDPAIERLIYGYDFLILIPEVTATTEIR